MRIALIMPWLWLREKTIISPFWEMNGPNFLKTWISFSRGCFVTSLDRNGSVVLKMMIVKFQQCIFLNATISSLKNMWSLIWTNLNSLHFLHPRVLCTKFGWNLHSGSGEKERENFTERQTDRRRTTGNQSSSYKLLA